MRNIAVKVSYDGTDFNGFQSQPKGRTVQDEIERALYKLTGEQITINGSGRTDAGVHAEGQVFNFCTPSNIPVERWSVALNTLLPKDIIVLSSVEVPADFHARFCAKGKTYRYTLDTGKFPAVLGRQYRLHCPGKLQFEAMAEGLKYMEGEHDFTSFTSTRSTKPHHVRRVYDARLEQEGCFWHMTISGNGFTYNMVRTIMGSLIWVGRGRIEAQDMKLILDAKDRSKAGPTAAAHGLVLLDVDYAFQI